MKYLTDSDIIKWNDRINDRINLNGITHLNYFNLSPRYNNRGGNPDIYINNITLDQMQEKVIIPTINYNFSFSVISHRKEDFFRILNKLFKNKFDTKLLYFNSEGEEVISDISLDTSLIDKHQKQEHKIANRSFIRYTYNFKNKVTDIICFLSYIEDAIEFFQLIWGYDENGVEISMLDFTIGSIVSNINNRSKDYLVIDYDFEKLYSDYKINYVLSEIIYDPKLPIVRYGKTFIFNRSQICHSRNNRIDSILN